MPEKGRVDERMETQRPELSISHRNLTWGKNTEMKTLSS